MVQMNYSPIIIKVYNVLHADTMDWSGTQSLYNNNDVKALGHHLSNVPYNMRKSLYCLMTPVFEIAACPAVLNQ